MCKLLRRGITQIGLGLVLLITGPASGQNDPPPVPGVCCIGPGGTTCIPVNNVYEQCFLNGRNYVIGGQCSPNSCSNGGGACCFSTGACYLNYAQPACESVGGFFLGQGSNCAECSAPIGACCFPDGACAGVTESDCNIQGGSFTQGTCDPTPCAPGACCRGTSCVITSAFECITNGFEFLGAGSECQPTTCGDVGCSCRGDVNGDHSIDGDDILLFAECVIAGGSTPPSCLCADVSGNGQMDLADVAPFVALLLDSVECR